MKIFDKLISFSFLLTSLLSHTHEHTISQKIVQKNCSKKSANDKDFANAVYEALQLAKKT